MFRLLILGDGDVHIDHILVIISIFFLCWLERTKCYSWGDVVRDKSLKGRERSADDERAK